MLIKSKFRAKTLKKEDLWPSAAKKIEPWNGLPAGKVFRLGCQKPLKIQAKTISKEEFRDWIAFDESRGVYVWRLNCRGKSGRVTYPKGGIAGFFDDQDRLTVKIEGLRYDLIEIAEYFGYTSKINFNTYRHKREEIRGHTGRIKEKLIALQAEREAIDTLERVEVENGVAELTEDEQEVIDDANLLLSLERRKWQAAERGVLCHAPTIGMDESNYEIQLKAYRIEVDYNILT